jgi:diacylglycerol kinase (ATP)
MEMAKQDKQASEFKSKSGAKRVFTAFFNSIAGFKSAWENEHAIRQEVMLFVPATIVALLLPVSRLEKLVLIAVMVLVLVVELINSAIEAAIDRISLERHPLSKTAKDIGSAAVFLMFALAIATWAVVLWPVVAG